MACARRRCSIPTATSSRGAGGDRDAFESLLRRHYDRIHRVAWRMTGSRSDAEDIAQDVCCALVEKIGSFKGEAKFTTWLTGIVVNACRDHRRRGLTLPRLRERLAVLAGLAPRPDGRDAYRLSWLASELARLDPLAARHGRSGCRGGPDPCGSGSRPRGGRVHRLLADA